MVGAQPLLLAAHGGSRWRQAAERVGVRAVQLGRDVLPAPRQSLSAFGIGARGALLVRPDGFIAWCTTTAAPADPEAKLREVLARSFELDVAGNWLPPTAAAGSANLTTPHSRAHVAISYHPWRRA